MKNKFKPNQQYTFKGEKDKTCPSNNSVIEIDYIKDDWVHYKMISGTAPIVKTLRFKIGSEFDGCLFLNN